jgi:RimJ/RimL family protein N-acetyltransferase
MSVPIIETARLRLRGHTGADFDGHAALWGDRRVTRFIGGKPSTREEAWGRLLRLIGLWPTLGFGYWLVEEQATGAYVGDVGFADFKRDMEPSFGGAPEHGWALSPALQGKGYATEAVAASLDWARKRLPGRDCVCMIDPENAPSLKVAQKVGYREYARTTYKDAPIILLRA